MTAAKTIRHSTVLIVALLAACSANGPPPPKAAKVVRHDWLREIRAEAANAVSAVQVIPLADPAVDDLRRTAREQEGEGDYVAAADTVKRAMTIRPEDPSLWQWLAELSLMRGDYGDAERQAQRAYDLGPKLGELCVRDWLTIHAARVERGEAENAASAKAQVPACQIAPPIRM